MAPKKKRLRSTKSKKNVQAAALSDSGDDTEDEFFSKSEGEEEKQFEDWKPKVNMLVRTNYNAVKEAGKLVEFHMRKKAKKDWDNAWFDGPYSIKFLKQMQPHQRVNHFPGIYNLTKKNMLGRYCMRMQRLLPNEYDFFPTTYCLPSDYKDLL